MKKIILSSLAAAALTAGSVNAQVLIGSSSGSDYTTATWTNEAPSAFGQWFIQPQGDALNNISDSTQNGRTSIGSESFFIVGGTANEFIDVFAPLGGSLASGQSVSLNANYSWNGGTRGIEFEEAFGVGSLFRFEHGGGSDALNFGVGGTTTEIFASAFNQAFTYNVAFSSASEIAISASLLGAGSPFFTTNLAVTAMPNQVKFYTGGYSDGADQDNYGLYFNSVTTVPEPSTYALLTLGALALGGYAARRRARK